jgi:hypothetical protein
MLDKKIENIFSGEQKYFRIRIVLNTVGMDERGKEKMWVEVKE